MFSWLSGHKPGALICLSADDANFEGADGLEHFWTIT